MVIFCSVWFLLRFLVLASVATDSLIMHVETYVWIKVQTDGNDEVWRQNTYTDTDLLEVQKRKAGLARVLSGSEISSNPLIQRKIITKDILQQGKAIIQKRERGKSRQQNNP